jgi:hypothetical protein
MSMYVIGNGESRKNIDIDQLQGPKVGCNAIMRDYLMDYLVCVDTRMVDEAIRRRVYETTLVYTRDMWLDQYNYKNMRRVPDLPYKGKERWDDPWHWGSGPYAVLIAATYAKEREVKLIGFDLYGNEGKINNVYKDTDGYKESDHNYISPVYWMHQISMVFQCFPKIHFTIYQSNNWVLPKTWNERNITVDNINNLI